MYDVIIRKSVQHADGSKALEEEQWQVNHEFHARNLAEKIARRPGVQWVEVEEVTGQFKACAHQGPDGIVHESLESKQFKGGAKRRPHLKWTRKTKRILWTVAIAVVCIWLLLTLAVNK